MEQMPFPDMLCEGGVKGDDVFASSKAAPGTEHVGRIVGQWANERDVVNFVRKRENGRTADGSFFKRTNERSAALRARAMASGCSMAALFGSST